MSLFIIDLFFALAIAGVLTALFAVGFQRRGSWASLPAFFLILFLATWAGGIWTTPVGPVVIGAYWLPFAVIGVVTALLLAASASSKETPKDASPSRGGPVWLAALYSILLVLFFVAVFAKYVT